MTTLRQCSPPLFGLFQKIILRRCCCYCCCSFWVLFSSQSLQYTHSMPSATMLFNVCPTVCAQLYLVCVYVCYSRFFDSHSPVTSLSVEWRGMMVVVRIFLFSKRFFFSFSSVSFLSNGWWWWQWWWWDGRWLCCALTNYMLPSSILSLLSTTPQSRILRHSLTITLTRTPLSTHNDSSAVIKL